MEKKWRPPGGATYFRGRAPLPPPLLAGIFLGLFGRGDKLKDYKYKGGRFDAFTDELGKSRVIIELRGGPSLDERWPKTTLAILRWTNTFGRVVYIPRIWCVHEHTKYKRGVGVPHIMWVVLMIILLQ